MGANVPQNSTTRDCLNGLGNSRDTCVHVVVFDGFCVRFAEIKARRLVAAPAAVAKKPAIEPYIFDGVGAAPVPLT